VGVEDAVLGRGGGAVHDAVRSLAGHGVGVMAVGVDGPTVALGERVGGPVATVQLRRGLVARVGADPEVDRRVDAAVRHAHRRGATVLAVGVEHRTQLERLIDLGCDLVEGHLIGPPVPILAPGHPEG
jgi:predicted signal transduction protein with EAL and GGDEF domain